MLLKQLFEMRENRVIEDLGNLKQIEKGLMKAFETRGSNRANPLNKNNKNDHRRSNVVSSKLGRDSRISTKMATSGRAALNLLLDENDTIGVVMTIDDSQVFAVGKKDSAYTVAVNLAGIRDIFGDEANKVFKIIRDKLKWQFSGSNEKEFEYLLTANEGEVYTFFIQFIKLAKKFDMATSFLTVKEDMNRKKKQDDRKENRKGVIPLPNTLGFENYKREIRLELKDKLHALKNNKTFNLKTPEEMFEFILANGFIDKIRVGGFVYNRNDNTMRINSLKGDNDVYSNANTVDYKVDNDEYNDKMKTIRASARQISTDMAKDGASDDKINDAVKAFMKDNRIPKEISVVMKMDGASIIPDKIAIN